MVKIITIVSDSYSNLYNRTNGYGFRSEKGINQAKLLLKVIRKNYKLLSKSCLNIEYIDNRLMTYIYSDMYNVNEIE